MIILLLQKYGVPKVEMKKFVSPMQTKSTLFSFLTSFSLIKFEAIHAPSDQRQHDFQITVQ